VPETGIQLEPFCQHGLIPSLVNLTDLAEVTLAGLTLGWQRYKKGGIDDLLNAYLEFFAHGGQEIELPEGRGIIQSVTSQGELVVEVNNQTMAIAPGVISLGYPVNPREKS
jgi:BirA family biotin operon repressor/biotin-[acetyl-CoA-carboxylase] ligase